MASPSHSSAFGLRDYGRGQVAGGVAALFAKIGRRVGAALEFQERREVDLEISRLIAQSGGRLTDSVERDIAQAVLASDWTHPH